MALEGLALGVWVLGVFVVGALVAMLCRGLGKSTESNPELLANMGFWWCVGPTAMLGASAFFEPLDVSRLAYFGFVFGLIPIWGTLRLRTAARHAAIMFGRDAQGRMHFLGCRTEEVVTTLLYALLAFELANVFLWNELYR